MLKFDQEKFDSNQLWHPYSYLQAKGMKNLWIKSAKGVYLNLTNEQKLIDAMASWWCMIHGYNHPVLNQALIKQIKKFSHVMFGGLTHQQAVDLARRLLQLNNDHFHSVFLADSGSIAVEVALKMSLQYQKLAGFAQKQKIMTLKGGYYGDTLGAMSVCDPVNGMHHLFQGVLPEQIFAEKPTLANIDAAADEQNIANITEIFAKNQHKIAAFIIEPIVQGAGGMRFYSASLLKTIRNLCDQFAVLLIFDEIATGFGRTGKMFAYQHSEIVPDLICLGKALSGGYLNIAAVLAKKTISEKFTEHQSPLMHGPTFMANPLACAVSLASIQLLTEQNWQKKIMQIEIIIKKHFYQLKNLELKAIKDIRVLGAIGVIELFDARFSEKIQALALKRGIWIRPFGHLVYIMPPYNISKKQLNYLCSQLTEIVQKICWKN